MDEDTLLLALCTRIQVLEDALHTLESAAAGVTSHADLYDSQDVVIPGRRIGATDGVYDVRGWELKQLDEAWHKAQDALFPEQAADAYAQLNQPHPAF